VHEIAYEQETLEQFYLALMNGQRAGQGGGPQNL